MNKAVFLDRDGVINFDPGDYTYNLSEFKLNDGIIDNLKRLYDNGFLLILITNQGGISKGLYSQNDVDEIHNYLISELDKVNVELAEIYYCPHHSINENCLCRKPNSLMIEKSLARFNIDASKSFMLGDKMRDVESAEKAGVKGIQVDINKNIASYVDQILATK
ncbi:MAG: HAD family hydrolase [Bacteroidales bacterium]|nr:HAD family hydrolase [Bacteroidales bacterium]